MPFKIHASVNIVNGNYRLNISMLKLSFPVSFVEKRPEREGHRNFESVNSSCSSLTERSNIELSGHIHESIYYIRQKFIFMLSQTYIAHTCSGH